MRTAKRRAWYHLRMSFERAPQGVVSTEQLAAVLRDCAEKGGGMDENALKLKDAWLVGRMEYAQDAEEMHEQLLRQLTIAEEMIGLQLLSDARRMLEEVITSAKESGEEEIAADAMQTLAMLPTLH